MDDIQLMDISTFISSFELSEKLRNSCFLITGATGFVGSKVLDELIKKYSKTDLIALSSKELEVSTILHNNYDFDENYLLNNGCKDVEILIHIGAFTPKSSSDADNIKLTTSNINNTLTLLSSKLPKLKKIIFISTLDIYQESKIIDETTQCTPVSLYGWSKLYCEKMITSYAKKNNIIYQILRLGHVFGEGEELYKKILPLTIKKVINNEEIQIWGDGKAIRTFIYIDDVVQAIINSINLQSSNIINIVGEEKITINELINKIIKISGKNIKISHVETNIPNRNLIFDNSLMKKLLLPEITKFDNGLEKEYKYMEKL